MKHRTRSSWRTLERGGIPLCASGLLESHPGLVHAFTLRGFNLSRRAGPDAESAARRRRRLCDVLGLDFSRLTLPAQVHGDRVFEVDEDRIGAGRYKKTRSVPDADGLVTDRRGVALMALSADCPLILAFDPDRPAIGLAHAGWRGTVAGIAEHLVERMTESFDSRADALLVGIAPSAGPERYEVRDDVLRAAADHGRDYDSFFLRRDGRVFMDLWSANVRQLCGAGVRPDRINVARICTITDERFYSYRRDGPSTGHAALIAALL